MVTEDYSSYEEYDLPPAPVRKDPIKKNQLNLTQTAGSKVHAPLVGDKSAAAGGKSQSSLSAFFGAK
jgi:hypothetical protein